MDSPDGSPAWPSAAREAPWTSRSGRCRRRCRGGSLALARVRPWRRAPWPAPPSPLRRSSRSARYPRSRWSEALPGQERRVQRSPWSSARPCRCHQVRGRSVCRFRCAVHLGLPIAAERGHRACSDRLSRGARQQTVPQPRAQLQTVRQQTVRLQVGRQPARHRWRESATTIRPATPRPSRSEKGPASAEPHWSMELDWSVEPRWLLEAH